MKQKEDMAYLGSENMTITTGTISTKYLEGYNDGYKKAMEHAKSESVNVLIDGKKIGESIYPKIKELSEREEKFRSDFNAN